MPDITMCPGDKCPRKSDCYRATATPSERQSYFAWAPFRVLTIESRTNAPFTQFDCPYYSPIVSTASAPETK